MNQLTLEETRKQQILEAALTCFTRKGYFQTTMDEIVEESGMSKGALYWYYKSKKELFLALFDFYLHSYMNEIEKHISPDDTYEETLKKMGSIIFKLMESDKEHMVVFMEFMSFGMRDDDMKNKISTVYRDIMGIMEVMLMEKMKGTRLKKEEISKIVSVFAVLIDGLMLYHMFALLKEHPNDIWNYFIEMFSTSISNKVKD